MIVDAEFSYSTMVTDHCGTCIRCIDACPTDALYEPYRVDANRCITHQNIELKDEIPEKYHETLNGWLFGCDICQDVCPWNQDAAYSQIEDFTPREKMLGHDIEFWQELDEDQYAYLFNGTPVRRAKFDKLKKTIDVVAENMGEE